MDGVVGEGPATCLLWHRTKVSVTIAYINGNHLLRLKLWQAFPPNCARKKKPVFINFVLGMRLENNINYCTTTQTIH